MARKVGVLGGAFNPPHVGHLILAQEAIVALGLDEVILVPTGEAPHKLIDPEPGAEVRLALAAAAVEDCEGIGVSGIEAEREGPSYSYRTLELLSDELVGSQLTFIMGADVAAGLAGWRRPERVLELARIAVAGRPGFDSSALDDVVSDLGAADRVQPLEMPEIGISSTLIRERVAARRPIRWLVPSAVAALIAERGLYAGEGAVA